MKKVGSRNITYHQFMYIIIGSMIGTGVLSLPNELARISKQDAWISAAIGVWYPLYMGLLAVYMSRKFPEDDIISISKKCFGRFLGSIFSFLFILQFLVYVVSVTAGFSNVVRVYIVEFLSPIKVIIIILLLGLYGTYQDLKVIGRVNELTYYFLIVLMFIPLMVFRDGSTLNVSPVLASGVSKILKGSMQSSFAYAGVEIIFLIYPYMVDKKNIKSASIKSAVIIGLIYTWVTFTTIYFLGPDIAPKSYWSFLTITETINIPFINNFRFLFMFIWSLIIYKTVVNLYYAFTYGLCNFAVKLDIKKVCIIIYPLLLYLAYRYGNEISRRNLIGLLRPKLTYLNLVYLTLIAIILFIKKGTKSGSA